MFQAAFRPEPEETPLVVSWTSLLVHDGLGGEGKVGACRQLDVVHHQTVHRGCDLAPVVGHPQGDVLAVHHSGEIAALI